MPQYVFTMQGVSKTVPPGRRILDNISLSFFPGAKIGVLGLNGSGKSSLLRVLAGVDREFEGEARPQKDLKVGLLPQEPTLDPTTDVRGNVEVGLEDTMRLLEEFETVSNRFAEALDDDETNCLIEKQGELTERIEALDGWGLERSLEIAADALRLPPWDAQIETLSGGERRRVALCSLLLAKPDMLLLDEPTNHLDAESVAWLERFLQDYPGTVVAVTHDRYFLDNVAGWILELDRGRGIPFEGNYTAWLEAKDRRLELEARSEHSRQRAIKAELDWVRANPRGRQSKSKARLQHFDELMSVEVQRRNETAELYIPPGPRLGDQVLSISSLSKSYDKHLLIDKLSLEIAPGSIVGIIGGNGTGKTTLFNLLTGEAKADEGQFSFGSSVELAHVDQSRDSLSNDKTVWEEISAGQDIIRVGNYELNSRAYAGRFNFRGSDQQKRVGQLSGGERNRVHLAKVLRRGGNVILLDEPTNDLDVETLRALEEALLNFPGSALVISHDRWFLDRIATHILAFEGNSSITFFDGNYSDYEKDFQERRAQHGEGIGPTRIKYKPLAR
ncbi:MAG TPA: energy-dependent translational throttle protein EttA [Pseudomonadales bacterium]|jgi:sulfate-transporting ATPase|nr:energy-dependent translational throttle protein EttA [Pseudomonadales bacterium]